MPVRLSDVPELSEQEPNDEPAKANKLPVPGGVSARFEKAGDVDHFKVACKKGTKYTAAAMTYEINTPTEVLIRVLDAKGAEIGRSNPAQASAKVDFTAGADGDYIIACEQLNYLSGPNEIYHLSVHPATGDFAVTLALDHAEAPIGGGTAVMATVTRLNGFTGAIDLNIAGNPALSGKTTLAAGQTIAFVPLFVKEGTKPGAYAFRVRASAKVGDRQLVRFGTLTDAVKATMGGIPNPPPELLDVCAVAAIEKPAFALGTQARYDQHREGEGGQDHRDRDPRQGRGWRHHDCSALHAAERHAGSQAGPKGKDRRGDRRHGRGRRGNWPHADHLPRHHEDWRQGLCRHSTAGGHRGSCPRAKKKEEPKKEPPKKKEEPKKKKDGTAGPQP